MTTYSQAKEGFATRLSQQTLARLDELVRSGRFKSSRPGTPPAVNSSIERSILPTQSDW